MIVSEIQGDLLSTHCKHIAHGVNCQNKMGSGVAKALFTKYPEIKDQYHYFCDHREYIPEDRLGKVDSVFCNDKTFIHNCFTQLNYGYDGKKYVSYEAIIKCFKLLNFQIGTHDLAIPKIGCGLAGGNWQVVRELINEVTPDVNIYVYDINKSGYSND